MKNIIITVGTVTYAIKSRKLLARSGINSKLIKVDTLKNPNGCSYGIEISPEDFYSAASILRQNNVEYNMYNG